MNPNHSKAILGEWLFNDAAHAWVLHCQMMLAE
jgi:hypothetical protein